MLVLLFQMSPLTTTPSTRSLSQNTNNNYRSISSTPPNVNMSSSSSLSCNINNNGGWLATCLRPPPPFRPCLALGSSPHGSPSRSSYRRNLSHNDDAQILKVIEAYCTSTKPKNTISTGEIFLVIHFSCTFS